MERLFCQLFPPYHPWPLPNNDNPPASIVEPEGFAIHQGYRVFDSDAEPAGEVDARLDAEGHAVLQYCVVALHEVWWLMTVEHYAMAQAMSEIVTVTRLSDNIARNRIERLAGHAGA